MTGSWDGSVKLWDIEQAVCTQTLTLGPLVHCLNFFPSTSVLVVGMRSGEISSWDLRSQTEIVRQQVHSEGVWGVQQDRTKLVTGSKDNRLQIFDVRAGWKSLRFYDLHEGPVGCLAFDATRLVSGGNDCRVYLMDFYELSCDKLDSHQV